MDTWSYTSSVVHIDGVDVQLPTWAFRQPLQPPSSSSTTRLDVFQRVKEEGKVFDIFASKEMKDVDFASPFVCGICLGFLQDPAPCPGKQCKFIACYHCLENHYEKDARCPVCRRVQELPDVDKNLEPYLAEELRRRGIVFRCNMSPPGSREGALWCCDTSFETLRDFQRHVSEQWSFLATRLHCKRHLHSILSDSGQDQPLQITDHMRGQLKYVLTEDAVMIQAARSHSSMLLEARNLFATAAEDASAMIAQMRARTGARSRSPRRAAAIENVSSSDTDE